MTSADDKMRAKIDKMFNHGDGCLATMGMMKPEDYYQYCVEKRRSLNLKEKALKKLGIEEEEVKEVTPLIVWGFKPDENVRWLYRLGNIALSPTVETTFMFFSESRVYLYNYSFNTISGAKKESSDEFSYRDIVNISTIEETVEKRGGKKGKEIFTTTFTMLALTVPGDKMIFGCINDEDTERMVKAVKQKLREKKE